MRRRDGELAGLRFLVREALATEAGPGEHPTDYALASYIEGGLTAAAEEQFERHVAFCPECAMELVLARRGAEAAEEEDRRSSGWKIAVGFAVLLVSVVAAVMAGRAVGDRLQSSVVARLQSTFGGKVAIQGAELRLAGGPGMRFSGLSIADPAGGEPLVTAPEGSFTVDVDAAMGGSLEGTLHLDHPVLNVVRDSSDHLNFDAILPKTGGRRNPFDLAAGASVSRVEVADGHVRVIDRAGGMPREIHLAAVDASLSGLAAGVPAHIEARAGLESPMQNLVVRGSIGPWGAAVTPSYVFDRVALQGVPMRAWPRLGEILRGGLSFDGRLASAGETWSEISRRTTGAGDLSVVAGSLAGRNLIATVLGPLLPEQDTAPRLALLAAADTRFEKLSSPIEVASLRLNAQDLQVRGAGYEVTGRGSLGADGDVSFEGHLALAAELSRDLVAAAPSGSAFLNERGELSLPFRIAGTWPDVRASVDVEQVVRRVLMRRGFALFSPALDVIG
jgi:hypothetical protein